jgi:hypothetical protein
MSDFIDDNDNKEGKGTSQKKIESNRRNALLSTGPITAAGKESVSQNARKHGLLAIKQLVIPGEEDPEEFAQLLDALIEDYRPQGKMEELLVYEITTCQWRLRRAPRCESGEIRKSKDDALAALASRPRDRDPIAEAENRRDLYPKLELAKAIMAEAERSETLRPCSQKRLLSNFPEDAELQMLLTKREPGDAEEFFSRLVTILWTKVDHFTKCIQLAEGKQRHNTEAQLAAATLPPSDCLERIMRYESRLKAQMYKAMAQLERLQLRRAGQVVPAPISLEVNLIQDK